MKAAVFPEAHRQGRCSAAAAPWWSWRCDRRQIARRLTRCHYGQCEPRWTWVERRQRCDQPEPLTPEDGTRAPPRSTGAIASTERGCCRVLEVLVTNPFATNRASHRRRP